MDYLDQDGGQETDSSPSADAKAQWNSCAGSTAQVLTRGFVCIKLLTGSGEKWFACSAKFFAG